MLFASFFFSSFALQVTNSVVITVLQILESTHPVFRIYTTYLLGFVVLILFLK